MHWCTCVWDTTILTGERQSFHGSTEKVNSLGEAKETSGHILAVLGCEEGGAKAGVP